MEEEEGDQEKAWLDGFPDGPGWSPDGGRFYVRDKRIYWEDGQISDLRANPYGWIFRMVYYGKAGSVYFSKVPEDQEDYSQWTDEHREEVREVYRKARQARSRKLHERVERVRTIARAAKRKLTEEEWEALEEYFSERYD